MIPSKVGYHFYTQEFGDTEDGPSSIIHEMRTFVVWSEVITKM